MFLADKKIFEGNTFNDLHELKNFQQYTPKCDNGFKLTHVSPKDSCLHIFKIASYDNVTKISLGDHGIYSHKYCLQLNHDSTYEAWHCEELPPDYRQK